MKHSKLYTYLGIAGALLVPALAVATVEIPNVFEGGQTVSASKMNDNFTVMANAINALEAKVETLENAGLQMPIEIGKYSSTISDLVVVYQVHTDGVMTASVAGGNGVSAAAVRFDISSTEEGALNCDGSNCAAIMGRGFDGTTSSVFLPAGHYVAVKVDQLIDGTSATIRWQPLRGPDPDGSKPTLIDSSHP